MSDSTETAYQVLARKYRPQSFDDLLGHEAMVRTLRNAFAANRIAHAWILTGVRGVGKTTTARILARALNYETDKVDAPSIDMPSPGKHCQAIAESRHPDVMEMDAASRTGVGDIRELIDSVRYAPVEARYKVYIIDEVHMLSNSAFNALLKTLEEPPPHVKFIFATTEIRKVPVTVLSRCQRFDLRRFDQDTLADFLEGICKKEKAKVDRDGLMMIARAAEGSVRDALSLLDQAIIQSLSSGSKKAVGADDIQDMLGLADRSMSWELLEASLRGNAAEALAQFRRQYDAGADPVVVLRDLLELVHLLTRVKASGDEAASHGPAGTAEADRAKAMAADFAINGLTRAWGLLMKALEETQNAPDPAAAAEMGLIRLCYAADLPTPDEAIRMLTEGKVTGSAPAPRSNGAPASGGSVQAVSRSAVGNGTTGGPVAQLRPQVTPSTQQLPKAANQLEISTREELIALIAQKRDAKLREELEKFARNLKFDGRKIEFSPQEGTPKDLASRLTARLKDWTGERWVVSVDTRNTIGTTMREERDEKIRAHPLVKAALDMFPGAQLRVREAIEQELPPLPDADPMTDLEIDEDDL
jgi:DNA polymerase-3 subunit gamma/tau